MTLNGRRNVKRLRMSSVRFDRRRPPPGDAVCTRVRVEHLLGLEIMLKVGVTGWLARTM